MKWKLKKEWPWDITSGIFTTIPAGTLLQHINNEWKLISNIPFEIVDKFGLTHTVAVFKENVLREYEEWFSPIFEEGDWVSYDTQHLDVAEQLTLTGIIASIKHNGALATIIRPGPTIFDIHIHQLDIATDEEVEKEILSNFDFYYTRDPKTIKIQFDEIAKRYNW